MNVSLRLLLFKAGIVAVIATVMVTKASQGQSADIRVFADPEVRISYDGDVPHMEAPIAASATNPNMLFAAAELLNSGRSPYLAAAQIYYSHDAGVQWFPVPLPVETAYGDWDNAMAGGYGGTAYFITHDLKMPNAKHGLTAYRTNDGGKTWTASFINSYPNWDREYAIVDTTGGRYSGRLYVAGEGFVGPVPRLHGLTDPRLYGNDGVKVVRSSDGGRTFSPPVMACHRDGWAAQASPHPVVLSDGTLVVTCLFYPAGNSIPTSWKLEDFGVAVSSDGGKSFSAYRSVGHPMNRELPLTSIRNLMRGDFLSSWLAPLAAAPRSGLYSDRLYIAWSTFDAPNREVIYTAHSDDRGRTWSQPHAIYPVVSVRNGKIREAVPMLAVDKDGVVGLAWYDARNAVEARGYDIYFTASADGGETFTPPVRLTSATSHPQEGGLDAAPLAAVYTQPPSWAKGFNRGFGREASIRFASPYTIRPIGGDYATMTVDAAGRFHPLWPDARDGTWQLYTSTIRVIRDSQFQELVTSRGTKSLHSCDLTSKLYLVLGAPQWNPSAKEVSVSVQLENLSSDVLINPLQVRVSESSSVMAHAGGAIAAEFQPGGVLDPRTGAYGSSVEFRYSVTSGRPLFPYGVTAPRTWHFRVQQPEQMDIHPTVSVIGIAPSCLR